MERVRLAPDHFDRDAVASFFKQERWLFSHVAGGREFHFTEGDNWSIDPKTGKATYDITYFQDRGYTSSQALFSALRVIKHFSDTAVLLRSPEGKREHRRMKYRKRGNEKLKTWEDCRTYIKEAHGVTSLAPSLSGAKESLSRNKISPETDLTQRPKHLQFMLGVLRESVLPDEEVAVDPQVREAINKLRDVEGRDVIALATDPNQDPCLALRLSEAYIEPVIDTLYEEDIKDKQNVQRKQNPQDPSPQNPDGSGKVAQNPFSKEYEEINKRLSQPISDMEIETQIQEISKAGSEVGRQATANMKDQEAGKRVAAEYHDEYQYVEPAISRLRDKFLKIKQDRQVYLRRLVGLKEDGVMIDPGLITQTFLDIKGGHENPKTMKDFERVIADLPTVEFRARLVADRSNSMKGIPARLQRRSSILFTESFQEGSEILNSSGSKFVIASELTAFGVPQGGTETYKSFPEELTQAYRIKFFNELLKTEGGTNDYESLGEIEDDVRKRIAIDSAYAEGLKNGRVHEFVIIFSDGISHNIPLVKIRKQNLKDLGLKIWALGPSGSKVLETYGEDAREYNDPLEHPDIVEDLIDQQLDSFARHIY